MLSKVLRLHKEPADGCDDGTAFFSLPGAGEMLPRTGRGTDVEMVSRGYVNNVKVRLQTKFNEGDYLRLWRKASKSRNWSGLMISLRPWGMRLVVSRRVDLMSELRRM